MASTSNEREKAHELAANPPKSRRGTRPPPITSLRRRIGTQKLLRSNFASRGNATSFFSGSRLQRSLVKVSYSANRSKGAWAAHGRYLAREGAQRDGERGLGFTATKDAVDIPKTLAAWQRQNDPRLFKLIVSPEAGAELDLRAHARSVMEAVERDFGTRIEWIAIDHHNTDNPHVHIVLRGVDSAGQELRIDREYVRTGFRQRSQEAATQVLGLRTERSIVAARDRVVERVHFTEIDRAILRRAGDTGIARYDGRIPDGATARELRLIELRRVSFLAEMGFTERVGERAWKISADLETALREFQRATDVLKARSRHAALLTDPTARLVRTELRRGESLIGRVVGTGLADEAADRRYVLVEGTDGVVHYVERPGEGASLRPGRVATLAMIDETVRGGRTTRLHVVDHGKTDEMAKRPTPTTLLDREALRSVAERSIGKAPAGSGASFADSWRRAVAGRLPLLVREGLVRVVDPEARTFELLAAGRRTLEVLMKTLERDLPSLADVASRKRREIEKVEPQEGSQIRGRLVAYATGENSESLAVVEASGKLLAVEVGERTLREGSHLRAKAEAIETDNQNRRLMVWRIATERELERGR